LDEAPPLPPPRKFAPPSEVPPPSYQESILNGANVAIVSPVTDPNSHKESITSCKNPFGNDWEKDEAPAKKFGGDSKSKRAGDQASAGALAQWHTRNTGAGGGDDSIELENTDPADRRSVVSGIYDPDKKEESIDLKIHRSLKGFANIDEVVILPHRVKGYCNNIFSKSLSYQVKRGRAGVEMTEDQLKKRADFCTVKTEPRSCDCLLWCLTLGFCGRATRFNLMDSVENNGFYFISPACGSPRMEVYTVCDDRLVGKVVKKRFSTELQCTDENDNLKFSVKGPASAMFFKCGKMKFHAQWVNPDGKTVNVGMTHNDHAGCYVDFGPQCKRDRQTKLLFLAAAFLIETQYYSHKFQINKWCS